MLEELDKKGFLVFKIEVPSYLRQFALDYKIPKDLDQDNHIELDYRYVDSSFEYLEQLKQLVLNNINLQNEMKNLIQKVPDVIVQELKPFETIGWHNDAHTYKDGTKLQFECLLYISNVDNPTRLFFWKTPDEKEQGMIQITHGTLLIIDCRSEKFLHSAMGTHDVNERVVTFLLGCR
jgi:hypothetical protein